MAPHGAYPCLGTDQWCAICVRDDSEWSKFCELLRPAASRNDVRFSTLAGRKRDEDELDALVAAWTCDQDKHALSDRLAALGIPAEALQDGREVFMDSELRSAGHYVRTPHKILGNCEMPGPPVRFSAAPVQVGPAPLLGEHNHEVFVDLLGMSEQEVAELVACGALA
jgi:benzylsuccinate CoA-transferase BbsF subunit